MRRLVSTSFVALALMLATAVPSAFANGTSQNAKLRVTLAELPTVVRAGEKMQALMTLENLTADRQHVDVSISIVTPLGTVPLPHDPMARDIAGYFHKSVRKSFTLDREAKAGQYQLVFTFSNGTDAPLVVRHNFTVQ